MLAKLEQLEARHEEISALLADPDTMADQNKFRSLSQEYSQLDSVAKAKRVLASLSSSSSGC